MPPRRMGGSMLRFVDVFLFSFFSLSCKSFSFKSSHLGALFFSYVTLLVLAGLCMARLFHGDCLEPSLYFFSYG